MEGFDWIDSVVRPVFAGLVLTAWLVPLVFVLAGDLPVVWVSMPVAAALTAAFWFVEGVIERADAAADAEN